MVQGGFIAQTNKIESVSLVLYGVVLDSPEFLTPSTQYSTLLKVDSISCPVNPSLIVGCRYMTFPSFLR